MTAPHNLSIVKNFIELWLLSCLLVIVNEYYKEVILLELFMEIHLNTLIEYTKSDCIPGDDNPKKSVYKLFWWSISCLKSFHCKFYGGPVTLKLVFHKSDPFRPILAAKIGRGYQF